MAKRNKITQRRKSFYCYLESENQGSPPKSAEIRRPRRSVKGRNIFDPTDYDNQYPNKRRSRKDKAVKFVTPGAIAPTTMIIRSRNKPASENLHPILKSIATATTTTAHSSASADNSDLAVCISCKKTVSDGYLSADFKCDSCTNRSNNTGSKQNVIYYEIERTSEPENEQIDDSSDWICAPKEVPTKKEESPREDVVVITQSSQMYHPPTNEFHPRYDSPDVDIISVDENENYNFMAPIRTLICDQLPSIHTPPNNLRDWTRSDVNKYFEKVFRDFPKIREVATVQELDGLSLLELTKQDCYTLLGLPLGNAIRLFAEIKHLRGES